ncbi:MAG: CARDB domain-containing protein [Chloroflexota bacterium]
MRKIVLIMMAAVMLSLLSIGTTHANFVEKQTARFDQTLDNYEFIFVTQVDDDTPVNNTIFLPLISTQVEQIQVNLLSSDISGDITDTAMTTRNLTGGGQAVFQIDVQNTGELTWEPDKLEVQVTLSNLDGTEGKLGYGSDAMPYEIVEQGDTASLFAHIQIPDEWHGQYRYSVNVRYDDAQFVQAGDDTMQFAIAAADVVALAEQRAARHAEAASAANSGQAVDLIFAMDTSGSMHDEFTALCSKLNDVIMGLTARGYTVNHQILGITADRDCTTGTVAQMAPGISNHNEDWAPAVYDLSNGYPWTAGYSRLIIPISDEGPDDGYPCNDPGDDGNAVFNAIFAAKAANVFVSPIIGSGYNACVEQLAQQLANGTGGQLFRSTDPDGDLVTGIIEIISNVLASSWVETSATAPTPADGTTTVDVTTTILDQNNAPVEGHRVRMVSSRSASDVFTPAWGVTDAQGQFTTVLKSTTPGTAYIGAEDITQGQSIMRGVPVEFTSSNMSLPLRQTGTGVVKIMSVKPKHPLDARYLQGIPVHNSINVNVDWGGTPPGTVKFDLNGQIFNVGATQSGASLSLDMGGQLRNGVNSLSITAINNQGKASEAKTFAPWSTPLPVWLIGLQQGGAATLPLFASGDLGGGLHYKLGFEIPPYAFKIIAPGFGVPEKKTNFFGKLAGQLSIPIYCAGSYQAELSYGSNEGFTFFDTKFTATARGNVTAKPIGLCVWADPEGTASFEVKGTKTIYRESVFVMVAYFNAAVGMTVDAIITTFQIEQQIREFGEIYLEGSLGLKAESKVDFSVSFPYLNGLSMSGDIGIKGGYLQKRIIEIDVWARANGSVKFDVSGWFGDGPTQFDSITLLGEVGISARKWWFKEEYTGQITWKYPSEVYASSTQITDIRTQGWHLIPHPSSDGYANFIVVQEPANGISIIPRASTATENIQASQTISSVLISNVYTYTELSLAQNNAISNTLLVYTHDDIAKPVGQSNEIRFSSWNGVTWQTPMTITNDLLQDATPEVTWVDADTAVATWVRLNETLTPTATWTITTANQIEIATATYSVTADAWSSPELLTNNNAMDALVHLASNHNGQALAVWKRNDAGRLMGDEADPDKLMASFYSEGWQTPITVAHNLPGILTLSAAYGPADEVTIAYSQLQTPTGSITPTFQIFTVMWDGTTWSAPTQRTDDTRNHTNPQVIYNQANQPLIIWRADSDVNLHNLSTSAASTLTLPADVGTIDEFQIVQTTNGDIAAVFTAQQSDRELYLTLYDQQYQVWGLPTQLTTNNDVVETNPSAVLDPSGRLLVAYTAREMTEITRTGTISETGEVFTYTVPTESQTNLNTLAHTFTKNLTVQNEDFVISNPQAQLGESVTLSVTIANTGDFAVSDVQVHFYNGDPQTTGSIISTGVHSGVLRSGYTSTLTTNFVIPTTSASIQIFAVIDPSKQITESNELDNQAIQQVFGADLVILDSIVEHWGGSTAGLMTLLQNVGTSTAPTSTLTYTSSASSLLARSGTQTITDVIPALAPGETYTLTTPWNFGNLTDGSYQVAARVNQHEADFAEVNTSNNSSELTLDVYPDLAVSPDYFWSEPRADGKIAITGTVFNYGSVSASNVNVSVYAQAPSTDTAPVLTFNINEIPAAGYELVSGVWDNPPDDFSLYLSANPTATIQETTRSNNLAVVSAGFTADVAPNQFGAMVGFAVAPTVTTTATVTAYGGFAAPISLTIEGLPTGSTYQVSANPLSGSGAVSIEMSIAPTATAGVYPLQAIFTGGSVTKSVAALLEANVQDISVSTVLSESLAIVDNVINYRVDYHNVGNISANDVVITATLPAALTYQSTTNKSGFVAQVSGNTVVWRKPVVASNEAGELFVTLHVPDTMVGGETIVNAVQVSLDGVETNYTNNTGSDTRTVQPQTRDLSVDKTLLAGDVRPDESITYTIAYQNAGNSPANNVVITDQLPAGITLVGEQNLGGFVTSTLGSTMTGTQVIWQKTSVAAGESGLITLTVHIDKNAVPGSVVTNVVRTASSDDDINIANNVDTVIATLLDPIVDVSVSQSMAAGNETLGNHMTYRLVYQNNDNSPAANVVVTATVPAHTSYLSSTNSISATMSPVINGSQLVWSLGTISGTGYSNNSGWMEYTVLLSADAPVDTSLVAMADISTSYPESDDTNNHHELVRTARVGAPDLNVDVYLAQSKVLRGAEAVYQISYANRSDEAAHNVILTTDLPSGFSYLSSTGGPTPTVSDNQVTWALGAIPRQRVNGYQGQIVMTVDVAGTVLAGTAVTNTVLATTPNDTDLSNNSDQDVRTIIEPTRDLYISLQKPSGVEVIGHELTYHIGYRNEGNAHLTDVVITDTLPTGAEIVSTTGLASPTVTGNQLIWQLGTVPGDAAPGYTGDLYVTIRIPDDTPPGSTFVNQVVGSTTITETGTRSNQAEVRSTIQAQYRNLSVTNEWANDGTSGLPKADDELTYRLQLHNSGNSAITNIWMTDTLPAHATYVGWSGDSSAMLVSTDNGQVVWQMAALAANSSSGYISVTVRFDAALTSDVVLVNHVAVWTSEIETDYTDNEATHTQRSLIDGRDLKVQKAWTGGAPIPGNTLTYQLTYHNLGTLAVNNVILTDTLPAGTTFLSADAVGWTQAISSNVVTWQRASVDGQATGHINVTVLLTDSVAVGSALQNDVTIASSDIDDNVTNNTAQVTLPVIAGTRDLSIDLRVDSGVATPGGEITYRLTYRNDGSEAAHDVQVLLTLPSQMSVFKSTGNFTPTVTGNKVVWSLGTVPAVGAEGHSGTLYVTVDIAPSTPLWTRLHAASEITTSDFETGFNSNTDTAVNVVEIAYYDVRVVKQWQRGAVTSGNNVLYRVVVYSDGNTPARNVSVVDTLPAEMSLLSHSSPYAHTVTGDQVNWTIDRVSASTEAVIDYYVHVDEAITESITLTNTVQASMPLPETDDSDNQAQVGRQLVTGNADLAVEKRLDAGSVLRGENLTYRLRYTNNSDTAALNVVMTDTLPADLTYVSSTGGPAPLVNQNQLVWQLGSVAGQGQPNDAGIFYVTARVNADAAIGAVLTNTVSIQASNEEQTANNAVSDLQVVVTPEPVTLPEPETAPEPEINAEPAAPILTVVATGTVTVTSTVTPVIAETPSTSVVVSTTAVPDTQTPTVTTTPTPIVPAPIQAPAPSVETATPIPVVIPTVTVTPSPTAVENLPDTGQPQATATSTSLPTATPTTISTPTPLPVLQVSVQVTGDISEGGVRAGDTVVFVMDVQQMGDETMQDVQLLATIPDNTTFNKASSDPRWNLFTGGLRSANDGTCTDGLSAGGQCAIPLDDMERSQSMEDIQFAVTIDEGVTETNHNLMLAVEMVGAELENGNEASSVVETTVVIIPSAPTALDVVDEPRTGQQLFLPWISR